jgi:hypothetical protein
MGSPARYACYKKEMLGWIRGKMATPESAQGDGRFFAFGSTTVRNDASTCNNPCAPGRDYLIVARNDF